MTDSRLAGNSRVASCEGGLSATNANGPLRELAGHFEGTSKDGPFVTTSLTRPMARASSAVHFLLKENIISIGPSIASRLGFR